MAGILLSGPAGAAKSTEAKRLLTESAHPMIAADFQAIVAALLLLERGPDGRYPVRPPWILPIAEYLRLAAIGTALGRDIDVVATNSDGSPSRRAFLLDRLGPGSSETVIDPGEDVVRARLSDPVTGELEDECASAINRWYRWYRRK